MIKLKVGHLYRSQCGCILRDKKVLSSKNHYLCTLYCCDVHADNGPDGWIYKPGGLFYGQQFDECFGLHIKTEIKP